MSLLASSVVSAHSANFAVVDTDFCRWPPPAADSVQRYQQQVQTTLTTLLNIIHSLMTRAGHVQVASAKAGQQVHAPHGASGSTKAHLFGWRDAMDIIVKWRQLSEPNDQVCVHAATCAAMLSHTHSSKFLPAPASQRRCRIASLASFLTEH